MTRSAKSMAWNVRILVSFMAIAFAGCGLQDIPNYFPPTIVSDGSQNSFRLVHSVLNHDPGLAVQNFKGYDILYRAYADLSAASLASGRIRNEITRTGGSPEQAYQVMRDLGYKKFASLRTTSDTLFTENSPLFDFILSSYPSAAPIDFTIFLRTDGDWYYHVKDDDPTYDPSPVPGEGKIKHPLRRFASGSESRAFNDRSAYLPGDLDYEGSVSAPDTLYLVFFGVTYGIDPQNPLQQVPSFPAPLESLTPYIIYEPE